MNLNITMGQYYPVDSFVHRLDPQHKNPSNHPDDCRGVHGAFAHRVRAGAGVPLLGGEMLECPLQDADEGHQAPAASS